MYHNPQAVVQVNRRRSGTIAIERSVRQGCPLSPLPYVQALEPLLRRLRDRTTTPALRGVCFAGPLTARVSAFADDITVFVSRRLEIKAGSLKDLHTWAGPWQGTVWRRKASRTFPRLKSDPKAEGRRKPLGETLFVRECRKTLRNLLGSSDLSRPRKELYRELVVGSASDPLSERRGWTAEEICSHWNWAPGSSFLNNSEFSLTWRLIRNALPLLDLNYKAGLADMPDCPRCASGLEETAENAFYYCERVRPFWDHVGEWTARIEPKQLVLLDVGYVVDNVLPPFQGEKRVVFLAILPVARMVIWSTRNKGLYDDANFSHRDLDLYFRHLLWVKIRCDRKRLDRITFSKRWVNAVSLVVRKGATLESSFPPLPAHGVYGTGP